MRWLFVCMMAALTGLGCAANCKNIQQQLDTCQATITDQDFIIKKQESTMRQKDQQADELKNKIHTLETQIAELNRRLNISSSEKGRYDERIKNITYSVREFLRDQMRETRNFLTDVSLEDFIGNELIERGHSGETELFIVDVLHPVPSEGQINGIGGYFLTSADIVIKLIRPVGKDYVVIYDKQVRAEVNSPGKLNIDFDSPFIVQKSDIIAFYFPGTVNVPYDVDIGTDTYSRMKSDKYKHGDKIADDDIWHAEQIKRKYSLNYYGVFNTKPDFQADPSKLDKWDTLKR